MSSELSLSLASAIKIHIWRKELAMVSYLLCLNLMDWRQAEDGLSEGLT